jgi:hypothetical protein
MIDRARIAIVVCGVYMKKTWRDSLPVHPAADLFPSMSGAELRELGENIKADGLQSPVIIYDGQLLDGRNRLDAMALVGIKFEVERSRSGNVSLRSEDILICLILLTSCSRHTRLTLAIWMTALFRQTYAAAISPPSKSESLLQSY